MKNAIYSPLLNPLLVVIWMVAIVFLLITEKVIFMPLALGLLFAFFLLPAVRRLERRGFPRVVAIGIMIILTLGIVVAVGMLMSFAVSQFIGDLPQYKASIVDNTLVVQRFIEKVGHVSVDSQRIWFSENVNLFELGVRNIGNIATGIGRVVTTLGLTFVFSFFILYYRNKTMVFFKKLLGQMEEVAIFETFKKLIQIVPRYLSGVF